MLLAIESSCDESAVSLFDPAEGVLYSSIYSQVATHTPHGGVVPELAVREHLKKFPELLSRLPIPQHEVTQVAVTVGPGLAGSLAMGVAQARAIALQYNIPIVGINHLRAHAFSPFIGLHKADPEGFPAAYAAHLPHLGLLVSGGNTILFEVTQAQELKLIARTLDDAAGEALDKAAKMLGLGYPGGPLVEKLAATGNPFAFEFPKAFAMSGQMAFSFSGLKTALRYQLQKMTAAEVEAQKNNLAASYQNTVVASLVLTTTRALKRGGYRSIGLAGGVAQNGALRKAIADLARNHELPLLMAAPEHCGDNAAMVAFAAFIDPAGQLSANSFLPSIKITNE